VNAESPARDKPRFGGRRYPFELFDRHLCLKAPPLLLLCGVYLSSPLLMRLVQGLARFRGKPMDLEVFWGGESAHWFVAGAVPAFLVLISYAWRSPHSVAPMRWFWRFGAWLMALSALMLAFPALLALGDVDPLRLDFIESPLLLALNAVIAGYVFLSARARDAFSDLPEPEVEQSIKTAQ
jgi:hypothetical protein